MKNIKPAQLILYIQQLFRSMGCSIDDSLICADVLVKAEMRGISSHGLSRLPEYIALFDNGRVNGSNRPFFVRERVSTALIDGNKTFGMISSDMAMRTAIEKAKVAGTGWVSVRNSYHFGIAGYYSMLALEHNMIGIAMTNANPLVAPYRGSKGMLGTNPMSVAIPALKNPPIVIDMATAPISRGKLDIFAAAGMAVEEGLVQDHSGKGVTDSSVLKKGGAILPLGVDTEHAAHKGYCLSAMVDLLSAVLPGANFGPLVVPTLSYLGNRGEEDRGIGHFFGAISIDAFRDVSEFFEDVDLWIQLLREAPAIDKNLPVLIPGDPERINETNSIEKGIQITDELYDELLMVGARFNIPLKLLG